MMMDEQAIAPADDDETALAAQAADPDTPTAVLLSLAARFPAAFCANPVFPLLLIEHPDLPSRMDDATQRALLRYAGTPRVLVDLFAAYGSADLAREARLHVAAAGAAGAEWPALAREVLRALVAERLNEAEEQLLIPFGTNPFAMIEMGAVPAWLAEGFAGNPTMRARAEALRAESRALPARVRALSDPATPAAVLASAAEDDDPQLRAAVAAHPAASAALLTRMLDNEYLGDGHPRVLRALSLNPNAPPQLRERIVADQTWISVGARVALLANPSLAPELVARLADDISGEVRRAVLFHPAAPPAFLADYLAEAQPTYSGSQATLAAWLSVNLPANPPNLLAQPAGALYRLVALSHPHTPPAALARAVTSLDWLERLAVARHPAAPSAARAALAADGNRLVRAAAEDRGRL